MSFPFNPGFLTAPTVTIKSKFITGSGSFNPLTDGQGRTVFKIRYGGGGGGGNQSIVGQNGTGGGHGQMFEIDWLTITSAVTITIGAAGAISGAGGDTILTGGFIATAYGGQPGVSAAAGSGNGTGGLTYAPGHNSATERAIAGETGGSLVFPGHPGLMNASAVFTSTETFLVGNIQLSPGGAASASAGGGAGGYQGAGGAANSSGIGYCSGGGGGANGLGGGTGGAGFVEFFWM